MNESSMNLRRRIRETLELIASKEEQLRYQERAPMIDVSGEIFNQWEDWYYPHSATFKAAFSELEQEALQEFHAVFDAVASHTPQCLPPIGDFAETNEWKVYSSAAQRALARLTL